MLFLAPAAVAGLSIQWGNYLWPMLVIWVLGLVIVWRVRRLHITLTYVISFAAFAFLRSWITHDPWQSEISPITGPMYQLFIFFMVTDPKTTVRSKGGQCLVAFLVAVTMAFVTGSCGTTPGVTRLSSIPPPKHIKQTVFLPASTCQTCHPAQYSQWRTAMHAYAQHSPAFIAFNAYVLTATGGSLGVFCERCHTGIGI